MEYDELAALMDEEDRADEDFHRGQMDEDYARSMMFGDI